MNDVKTPGTPRKTRRQFDREAALNTAMELFWRHGYEATSMSRLLKALKLTAPSLYMAFGNKEHLFQEAVKHYNQKHGAKVLAPLNSATTAREAIEQVLYNSADLVASGKNPNGCLVSFGAINSADQKAPPPTFLKLIRKGVFNKFHERLQTAVAAGELPKSTDIARLARFYQGTMGAIQLLSLDGATPTELRAVAQDALKAWPGK
ncbi:MAG TPA: TetR/AcrR family transcriptional regulator [Verrucomicrobiae bacterium]|nr:TetR/AcrR family transcriptional regulator [Verrucomicrobiae bacterium]